MTSRNTCMTLFWLVSLALAVSPAGADEAVLPTTKCGDFFIAQVSINGKGPWPMILDSGAASTVLSDKIAGILGGVGQVRSVQIGDFKARGELHFFSRSMDQLSHALGTRIEGIVGHPVFQNVLLTYDYPAGEVRVGQGSLPAVGPGIVPTGKARRPYVRVRIGRHRFRALIDTGSGSGLTLSRAKRYRFGEPLRRTGIRVRINGTHYVRTGRLDGDVELGPLILRQPIVREGVKTGRHDNLVGQEILRDFMLIFDQANRRMQFQGPVDSPIRFAPYFDIGAAFDPKEKGWPVMDIFPGSGAEAAGLLVGDLLLARDGEKMWERDCPEDSTYDTEPRDVVLTVLRDGEEIDLTVTTRALVP